MPLQQICCGQITFNSGYVKESTKVMHNEIDALMRVDADYIVGPRVPASTCSRSYSSICRKAMTNTRPRRRPKSRPET
ncbi:heterodisulfide reductase-related iron-sulfur binding cluster [Bifidobacterium commune]|uniref:heterodisulfide reductase-related iron-sulfur binding cluster n=1 Tax=Bifidobacterium commune TaxID=1505727 RepID=UPI0035D4B453